MDEVGIALRRHYGGRLKAVEERIDHLLALPPRVLIDPLWATDPSSGRFLSDAFLKLTDGIRRDLNLELPTMSLLTWNTSDTGPGISRHDLMELIGHVHGVRVILGTAPN